MNESSDQITPSARDAAKLRMYTSALANVPPPLAGATEAGKNAIDIAACKMIEAISSINALAECVENPTVQNHRHPAIAGVLQFFAYAHLPAHLQSVSRPFCELAETIADGPSNAESTVALRKLLEAKDAAVRAVLFKSP